MKRKLALLLSAAVASSCFPGTLSVYGATFRDIDDVPWSGAGTVINSVADLGLLSGYEDGTFRAKNNVTYCEAAQMLYTTLMKTGTAQPLQAVDSYRYTSFLNTYRIPKWAHIAISYCLEKGILTTADIMEFVVDGKSIPATREDVAKMFGRALAVRYDVDWQSPAAAAEFADYWQIAVDAMPMVDLLKRLGIVSGNNSNSFRPKEPINRAEMAVILNKTYEVLTDGIGNSGTIKSISNNQGLYYYMEIQLDGSENVLSYHAMDDKVAVYAGSSNERLSLSRLSKGAKVSITHNGDALSAVRLLEDVPAQQRYDVTGYVYAFKSNELSLENENTGDIDKFGIGSGCACYLDGKLVTKKELQEEVNARSDEYAYVGLMIGTNSEKQTYVEGGKTYTAKREDAYATELHITMSDECTLSGKVDSLSENYLSYSSIGSDTERSVRFGPGCKYYINDTPASISELVEMVDRGTTYVKVTSDKTGNATNVILSEKMFSSNSGEGEIRNIYQLVGFSDRKIITQEGENKVTYPFGSENPLSNISFYIYQNGEWEKVSQQKAEKYYDDIEDKKIYCRLEFNSGGRIRAVSISSTRAAWRETGEQTERKGVVDFVSGNTLRFKSSTTDYKLLKQYNADVDRGDDGKTTNDDAVYTGPGPDGYDVRYPLIITSAYTSSRTVFEKMANADDVELYAEILADASNNVLKIDAKLTKAVGRIVEYEPGDSVKYEPDDNDDVKGHSENESDDDTKKDSKPTRYFTIETSDGTQLKLNIVRTPKLGCEDDEYTLQDLASTSYLGALVELGFSDYGEINKITVVEGGTHGSRNIRGTAVAAKNGLKLEGDSAVYPWLGLRKVTITHKSMNSTSLDKLIELIEDSDTKVYVSARLDERQRVDSITVQVEAASGVLEEYDDEDHTVRIKTADGHKLSFITVIKPTCDVNGITDRERLDDKCRGKDVTLTFNTDGVVSEIKD